MNLLFEILVSIENTIAWLIKTIEVSMEPCYSLPPIHTKIMLQTPPYPLLTILAPVVGEGMNVEGYYGIKYKRYTENWSVYSQTLPMGGFCCSVPTQYIKESKVFEWQDKVLDRPHIGHSCMSVVNSVFLWICRGFFFLGWGWRAAAPHGNNIIAFFMYIPVFPCNYLVLFMPSSTIRAKNDIGCWSPCQFFNK